MNVSRDLQYPQSSTSELLSCLVHLGYLRHDRHRRTFHPTARVAVLGHSVRRGAFSQDTLAGMIDELHADLAMPAILAMRHGNAMQFVHAAGAGRPLGLLTPPSLLHSSLGRVLLANCDNATIRQMIHRLNADAEMEDIVRPTEFLEEIELIRKRGFDISERQEAFAGHTVSIAMPDRGGEQLAVGVIVERDASENRIGDLVAHLRGRISGSADWNMIGISAETRHREAG